MFYDFGYRLRDLRLERKLTQTQVAKYLNLSKSTISGYENNIKFPSINVLIHLSVLYGVSADYILGLENRKMMSIDGLTESQQQMFGILLKEFKSGQKATRVSPASVLKAKRM